ncbi:uncharacterized protein LOC131614510 [Vicia villosa]|uniref:uncharacterized protein LOC131614510 n=1 Tax=Vicia villosa TaxID=3911 RepID=UPI00273B8103|nr:uncharacterized protein LOC131614510 [Vicia villosa]
MNIVSYNIRGCGNSAKRGRIRQLLQRGNTDMCFIQESKVTRVSEGLIKSTWGYVGCNWPAKEAEGRSGGIITIWKKGVIHPISSFRGKGLLGVNALWNGINCYFVNVYSSCLASEKRELWAELLRLKDKLEVGEWVVRGDFNAVKSKEERRGRGGGFKLGEIEDFSSFIDMMELVDVSVVGCTHTWINASGMASSRIDRFLLSEGIIQAWKIVAQYTGSRDISDHRPIWIKA